MEPLPAPVTLYGLRKGTTVIAFRKDDDKLYRVLQGTHEDAMATMHREYTIKTWLVRLMGFLMMWIGLALVVSPLNTVLDIVPFVGSAGRFVTSVVMFPIALTLSGITIVIAIVAHNPILLLVPFVLLIGLFAVVRATRKKARS